MPFIHIVSLMSNYQRVTVPQRIEVSTDYQSVNIQTRTPGYGWLTPTGRLVNRDTALTLEKAYQSAVRGEEITDVADPALVGPDRSNEFVYEDTILEAQHNARVLKGKAESLPENLRDVLKYAPEGKAKSQVLNVLDRLRKKGP